MAKRKEMSIEEALEQIKRYPVVDAWPTTAAALRCSRSEVYELIRRGEIECLDVGRRKKPISAWLKQKLQIGA